MSVKFKEESKLLSGALNFLIIVPFLILGWTVVNFFQFGAPLGPKPVDFAILFACSIFISFIPLVFGRMIVTVTEAEVNVVLGYVGWIRKTIPLAQVIGAESVKFRPLREFGGWGIRVGKYRGEKTGCFSMKGSEGVLLTLAQPTKFFIVSARKIIIASSRQTEMIFAMGK